MYNKKNFVMRWTIVLLALAGKLFGQTSFEVPKWLLLDSSLDSTKYLAEPMPAIPHKSYFPQMWEANWLSESSERFQWMETYPDSFIISWTTPTSEPAIGYPYHYGNLYSVNDTIKVRVYLDNNSAFDLPMAGKNPADWFYPVLYDPNANVFAEEPLADTSAFSYRFEFWTLMGQQTPISPPDTIFTSLNQAQNSRYSMIFNLWSISPGHFRVVLKQTTSLPSGIKLMVNNPNNDFYICNGQSALDTVNAYCKTATEAIYREEFTLASNNISNILSLNPKSIPAWTLQYHLCHAQGDTSNALVALDSLLNFVNNNLDPFVPDSSQATEYNQWWLEDYHQIYTFRRWRMRNPHVAKLLIQQ